MQHLLQQLMASPTAFSRLEVTSVVVVAIVAGMVIGGLAGTAGTRRRVAGAPLGYTIGSRGTGVSRGRRITQSNAGRTSGVAFGGWAGAGQMAGQEHPSQGSGQWVNLSAAATYLAPTTMLPLAALQSVASVAYPGSPPQAPQSPVQGPHLPAQVRHLPVQGPHLPGQAPQSPVSLLAPQSPAFLLAAPLSPAVPLSPATPLLVSPGAVQPGPWQPGTWQSGASPLVELQPVAFLPGIYQATTYRLDVTGRMDADQAEGRNRPLWRLGNALFSAARGSTARAITPPAGSAPDDAARPGRHRASRSKRIRRSSITADNRWMEK
jgi:hypothetical protein